MINKNRKVVCFGAGYVGGPTMAVMASQCPNYDFIVYDINQSLINQWIRKDLPIYEIGLPQLIDNQLNINLFFTYDINLALEDTIIIFLAVNTPTKSRGLGQKNAMDITYIESCTRSIGEYYNSQELTHDVIIVEKSTVPVKTSSHILKVIRSLQVQYPKNRDRFFVLSNPEFLAEGDAIRDLMRPDRVIIGGDKQNQEQIEILKQIYLHWVPEQRIITTNIYSSELCKLVANSFLAQRVSSINSISAICEKVGADVNEIKNCIGSDSRIGPSFLNASIGFGGSCLAKDLLSLIYLSDSLHLPEVAEYWRSVYNLNEYQKNKFSNMIINSMFNNLNGKCISIFGIAFKANTNDVRDSPAIGIIKNLLNEKAILKIYDPKVKEEQLKQEIKIFHQIESLDGIIFCNSPEEAVTQSHAIVILTEWNEFKGYNYEEFLKQMVKPAFVFDGRNILKKEKMENLGYIYYCIGK